MLKIAGRRLRVLGIPADLDESGRSLRGRLQESGSAALPLINSVTKQPIVNARFVVEGHDHLRFLEPEALRSLQPIESYSHMNLDSLLKSIGSALQRRAEEVQSIHTRLEKLGVDVTSKTALDRILATVEIPLVGRATMEAHADGLVLLECMAATSEKTYSMGNRSVDIDRFADATDFELFMTPLIEKALNEKVALAAAAPLQNGEKPVSVAALSAPPGQLSLAWLLDKVSLDCFAGPGLTLIRNLTIDGEPGRLELCFATRDQITGRIFARDGLRFEGEMKPCQLARIDSFLSRALQRGAAQSIEQNKDDSSALIQGLLPPTSDETWVMDVRVEQETDEEVRYESLNRNGEPAGAPRVLSRVVFEHVFIAHGAGYRMLVRVLETTSDTVTYKRLDAERQPTGNIRKISMHVFLSTFTAEAAAY